MVVFPIIVLIAYEVSNMSANGVFYTIRPLTIGDKQVALRILVMSCQGSLSKKIFAVDTAATQIAQGVCKALEQIPIRRNDECYFYKSLPLTKNKDGIYVTRDENNVFEAKSVQQGVSLVQERAKTLAKQRDAVIAIDMYFDNYVTQLKSALKSNGVGWSSCDERIDKDRWCLDVRFIGGDGAWSRGYEEDICDGGVLDKKVQKAVMETVNAYNHAHNDVQVSVMGGEKCYTYFEFSIKGDS